jgi:hypothetical protein
MVRKVEWLLSRLFIFQGWVILVASLLPAYCRDFGVAAMAFLAGVVYLAAGRFFHWRSQRAI